MTTTSPYPNLDFRHGMPPGVHGTVESAGRREAVRNVAGEVWIRVAGEDDVWFRAMSVLTRRAFVPDDEGGCDR